MDISQQPAQHGSRISLMLRCTINQGVGKP
jgi:hypothetical protein